MPKSDTEVTQLIINAYKSGFTDGRTNDPFQAAAGTLMRLTPELSLAQARRSVAEIICGGEEFGGDKVADESALPWTTLTSLARVGGERP